MMLRRWARASLAVVAAGVTALMAALAAGAHDTDLTDPNDTRGKLDVRAVRLAHDTRAPTWTVVTFSEWTVIEMWDRGFVEVLIDTRRNDRPEYYALVRANRFTLEGTLWRLRRSGPDTYLGTVPVERPSRRSVSIKLGLWRLAFGDRRDFYRWRVHTIVTGDVCRRTCHDYAPNGRSVRQWRPGRSPSPSVSPSPSPSPSPSTPPPSP